MNNKIRKYVYDGTTPGRPPKKTMRQSPQGFELRDDLMRTLDAKGWYREIEARRQRENIAANYDPAEIVWGAEHGFVPVDDPVEMDKLMCRGKPVAVVENATDLEVAHYNGRLVVEIDVHVHNDVLLRSIKAAIESRREQASRRNRFPAWAKHRILPLLDLDLMGYDLKKGRKQLARWLFPEVEDRDERGKRFDRACGYLNDAIANLNSLRAYPE